ncbi:deoxyribodipyrimidine photo-lyase [uncultured Pelagimonas sp.]|uniref:cryptochrome/photolyase family protein n=1 Tax=uncultured Pelagimonas sp. TaxID=1618102 RepID=UPI00261B39EE|nr:deoxyribodipyrimidine photo-lyase [uncultured Pelagimonas sp.]
MTDLAPIILWFRRDLRLRDHAALTHAVNSGRPVIPVFLNDTSVSDLGAAPKWRLHKGLEVFGAALSELGSRLILRSGDAEQCLLQLCVETGASGVVWQRAYDPQSVARDTQVKAALKSQGLEAQSFDGAVLHEPWTVKTGQGSDYKVYSAFRRAVWGRNIVPSLAPVPKPTSPTTWPTSEALSDWHLTRPMNRGGAVLANHNPVGEEAALERLETFITDDLSRYATDRDQLAVHGTSRLSGHLALGEISVARCWQAGQHALQMGNPGAETFLKELLWREFAGYLLWHSPDMQTKAWRPEWRGFKWNTDPDHPHFIAWSQARTGVPLVDAGMRELYVTGTMHNRVRMIVASYLTKHLRMHWRLGQAWFADCLTDWDAASNAMGWQWVAGCGPDASPYFRVFNPDTQRDKFDKGGRYVQRWLAETSPSPDALALSYFDAVPRNWGLSPNAPYPHPIVSLAQGRRDALDAYERWKTQTDEKC